LITFNSWIQRNKNLDALKDVQFLDKNDIFRSGWGKYVKQLPLQTCTCDIKNISRGEFIKKKMKPFDNIFKAFLSWQMAR
jgi:hypothetical protein